MLNSYNNFINEKMNIDHSINFKKWFKNSKVVDKNNNSLVVYHGAYMEDDEIGIDVFNGTRGVGWFSEDYDYAKNYTRDSGDVMELYLSIQKPYILEIAPEELINKKEFEEKTGININLKNFYIKQNEKNKVWFWYDPSLTDFIDKLERLGYDGMKTIEDNKYVCWLPFNQNQIKSINNNGNFSDSVNIYEHTNNYNIYLNESLRDKMKPKSDEEILKDLGDLTPEELLYQSAENNFINGVKIALERGVDINAMDSDNFYRTALIKSSIKGHKEIVELLIKKGADINDRYRGSTSLIISSLYGHKDIVELLIQNGADVNSKDKYGDTALMSASRHGYKDIVEILLKNGADVNIKNDYKNTALMVASQNGHKEIVELLKKYGATE